MEIEFIIFIGMIGVFLLANLLLKLPVSLSMIAGAIAGTLIGGQGIPLRHLFEGTFVYIDTFLIISTAMIFMMVIQESGALEDLTSSIVNKFYKRPIILLVLLMLMIMFPGMITGSSTAAVLSTGGIVAPILLIMGIPPAQTGAIIAVGAIMGMAAPPVNIPAMLIAGGVDMPFIGFEGPLLFLTIPCAIFAVLFLGLKHTKNFDINSIKDKLDIDPNGKRGFVLYLPILILITLMVATRLLPTMLPNLGMPLIFIISSFVGTFTGNRFNVIETVKEAMKITIPVLGKLIGVGMFIQVMTLTGVRGFIVINTLGLDLALLYIAIIITLPAFGAVSSYGGASVLGVPFLLALLSGNQIVTASTLSFIASLGDLMPPTALAGNYSAQIVREKYSKVLRQAAIPFFVSIIFALICLVTSKSLGFLVF